MEDRGLALLRQLMSEIEGAPFPGAVQEERYDIWYVHAQSVAQEALEYVNTVDPGYGKGLAMPEGFQ